MNEPITKPIVPGGPKLTKKQKDLLEYVQNRKFSKVPVRAAGLVDLDQEWITKLARLCIGLAEILDDHAIEFRTRKV